MRRASDRGARGSLRSGDRPGRRRCARADALLLLVGPAARAGLRRVDGERRRLVHDVLRLHEHELAAGVRHPDRRRPTASSPDGSRPGAADAFLSAPQPVPVHHQVPKDFGTKELIWTLTANGQTRKVLRVAQDRLQDRQAGDLHRGRRRQRQPGRRAADERAAGSVGRGRQDAHRQGRAAARRWSRSPAIPTTCRRAATASRSPA